MESKKKKGTARLTYSEIKATFNVPTLSGSPTCRRYWRILENA
jgi:hypothetical protein